MPHHEVKKQSAAERRYQEWLRRYEKERVPVERITKADLLKFLEQFEDDEEVTGHELLFLKKEWWVLDDGFTPYLPAVVDLDTDFAQKIDVINQANRDEWEEMHRGEE